MPKRKRRRKRKKKPNPLEVFSSNLSEALRRAEEGKDFKAPLSKACEVYAEFIEKKDLPSFREASAKIRHLVAELNEKELEGTLSDFFYTLLGISNFFDASHYILGRGRRSHPSFEEAVESPHPEKEAMFQNPHIEEWAFLVDYVLHSDLVKLKRVVESLKKVASSLKGPRAPLLEKEYGGFLMVAEALLKLRQKATESS